MASVGLICENDNIRPLTDGFGSLLELLNCREDDATRGAIQLGNKVFPAFRLFGTLPQQSPSIGKRAKELTVKVVAIGHDNDSRILKPFIADERAREHQHRKTFAGALCMPENAATTVSARLQGKLHALARPSNRAELVISADLLDDESCSLVFFEDDAVGEIVR